jgi:hypothetical protein
MDQPVRTRENYVVQLVRLVIGIEEEEQAAAAGLSVRPSGAPARPHGAGAGFLFFPSNLFLLLLVTAAVLHEATRAKYCWNWRRIS